MGLRLFIITLERATANKHFLIMLVTDPPRHSKEDKHEGAPLLNKIVFDRYKPVNPYPITVIIMNSLYKTLLFCHCSLLYIDFFY